MKKAAERKRRPAAAVKTHPGKCVETILPNRLPDLSEELLSKARYGDITPEQAERQAKAAGLPPFACEPASSKYDPMKESRWTLLQTISWIAWRDVSLVMQQSPEYRSRCTYWTFRPWNEPTGDRLELREGWFLEPLYPASALLLTMEDARMRCKGDLPASACLTTKEAELDLWRSLADDQLKAEAVDKNGDGIEIPAREWPRLKLFEERDEPVLKYNPLDAPAFTGIQFKRADVTAIWPRYVAVDLDALDLGNMTEQHFGLMLSEEAYVPFSVAVCWIATASARKLVSMRDETAWGQAAKMLLSHISGAEIDIIGCGDDQESKRLEAAVFDSSDCPHPYSEAIRYDFSERAHVRCEFYSDDAVWKSGKDDQFFLEGKRRPHWRRLRVRRSQVLEFSPKPPPTANLELECFRWLKELMGIHKYRPKLKSDLLDEARAKFHGLSINQAERAWTRAVKESPPEWRRRGPIRKV